MIGIQRRDFLMTGVGVAAAITAPATAVAAPTRDAVHPADETLMHEIAEMQAALDRMKQHLLAANTLDVRERQEQLFRMRSHFRKAQMGMSGLSASQEMHRIEVLHQYMLTMHPGAKS